ncbi:MAG: type II secretion system protein [Deltaproteobacteria bacterium]|nr:type II secretion system protein [Deltaproteobacteria bacterium]
MASWEWVLLLVLMAFISVLAVVQTTRSREAPFKQFAVRAARIGQALEAYARDHGGCYPPDGIDNQAPPGLSPQYIDWQEDWNVDYEVHPNGQGGYFAALEYLGRYKKNREYHALGLTQNPVYRQKYGRAQRIPGQLTRIWVFHESAPICPTP